MLAAVPLNPSARNPTPTPQEMSTATTSALPDAALVSENSLCPGCKNSVVSDNGGVVVAFGQSFFHVDCFKCAKCGNQVTADTNLLLLSDGSPICANCSYSCNVCHQPILDEAIMTGDDSYHAHCFKCRVCKNRIDELVFAKTSQGIYCMNCHNERVARSRRHAQKKREQQERERAKVNGAPKTPGKEQHGAGSPSRSYTSPPASRDGPTISPQQTGTSQGRVLSNLPARSSSKHASSLSLSEVTNQHDTSDTAQHPSVSRQFSVTVDPPSTSDPVPLSPFPAVKITDEPASISEPASSSSSTTSLTYLHSTPSPSRDRDRKDSLPLPSISNGPGSLLQRSKSTNDTDAASEETTTTPTSTVAPLNISKPDSVQGLSVPTKGLSARGGERRRSISPGSGVSQFTAGLPTPLSAEPTSSSSSSSPMPSPQRPTTPGAGGRAQTPPVKPGAGTGRDSPGMSSPLRDYFNDSSSSLPHAGPSSMSSAPVENEHHHHHHHHARDELLGQRSRAASSSTYESSKDPGGGLAPPEAGVVPRPRLKQSTTLDRVPPRTVSLAGIAAFDPRENPNYRPPPGPAPSPSPSPSRRSGEQARMSPLGLGFPTHNGAGNSTSIRPARSFDERERQRPGTADARLPGRQPSPGGLALDLRRAATATAVYGQRPASPTSPSYRVDVPRGVESEGDADGEAAQNRLRMNGNGIRAHAELSDSPPAVPPKERIKGVGLRPAALKLETNHNPLERTVSKDSLDAGSTASLSESPESSPVQRTSTATFIAPALPPIRFSMTGSDFSDLFKSVGGSLSSLKSLDQLSKLAEDGDRSGAETRTPPNTAVTVMGEQNKTPTNRSAFEEAQNQNGNGRGSPSLNAGPRRERSASSASHRRAPSPADPRPSLDGSTGRAHSSSTSAAGSGIHRSVSDMVTGTNGNLSPRPSLDHRSAPQSSLSSDRGRSSSESGYYSQNNSSSFSLDSNAPGTRITLTVPESEIARALKPDTEELVVRRLREALEDAKGRHADYLKLNQDFVETILTVIEQKGVEHREIKGSFKRASQQYMAGLTVAQTEYDKELKARREAEAEVTRLRVLLSGQAARLSAITSDSKRQELQEQLSKKLSDNLTGLERDVSKLKVERDLTLAEVEELSASKSSPDLSNDEAPAKMSRTLSTRFDNIKNQYARDLIPLTEQREVLNREIAELKAFRDHFLEETTVLNARNEELAQLNRQYIRQIELAAQDAGVPAPLLHKKSESMDRYRPLAPHNTSSPLSTSITASSSTLTDDSAESKFIKVQRPEAIPDAFANLTKPGKFIKWPGIKTTREPAAPAAVPDAPKPKGRLDHAFQQLNLLRIARCDHCGDKMWGTQFKCSSCNIAVHQRCLGHVQQQSCHQASEELMANTAPLPPSMFGRDLIEQVHADSQHGGERLVPIIVEKCIDAVEALAMDFEGIYRKTGGAGQSKMITQLFERGDYVAFDLQDTDRFNDICSVTSVLKTYFRQLPDPLFTYALHTDFVQASGLKDGPNKTELVTDLLEQLPKEHYATLRVLMLHLSRVRERSEHNLMNARNLGVVFGPTLMRSRDPAAEFTDMGAKALTVEWLVEHANVVFD